MICTLLFLIAVAAMLSATVSARMSWVLAHHYSLAQSPRNTMCWATGILSAAIVIVAACYVNSSYGLFGLLVLDIATVPVVGFIWLLIVGANKAVERIVNGVDVKLSQ